jgi:hypothetical protein
VAAEDDSETIETRLTRAWAFLSGAQVVFRHVTDPALTAQQVGDEKHVVLPVEIPTTDRHAALGLVLDRSDALDIATAMFALPAEELSEEDVDDACREACNVISACLLERLPENPALRPGLPRSLDASRYRALVDHGLLQAQFEGQAHSIISVSVFDPVADSYAKELSS